MEVIKVESREINVGLQSNFHLNHLYLNEFHAWYFGSLFGGFLLYVNRNLCSSCKSRFHLYCILCSFHYSIPWLYLKLLYYSIHVPKDVENVRFREGREVLHYLTKCAMLYRGKCAQLSLERDSPCKIFSVKIQNCTLNLSVSSPLIQLFVCFYYRWVFSLGFGDFFIFIFLNFLMLEYLIYYLLFT